jgi:hypothetical protein
MDLRTIRTRPIVPLNGFPQYQLTLKRRMIAMSHISIRQPFRLVVSGALFLFRRAQDAANLIRTLILRATPTGPAQLVSSKMTANCERRALGAAVRQRASFKLLIGIAAWATIGSAYSQTLIGSPGAGWQSWTPSTGLNDNGAPYWDVAWGASGNYGGSNAEKNVGFCLTSTGDCQGLGSALRAPGAIPFWGMTYDSTADTGGARDNLVYFRGHHGLQLTATLYLNASAVPTEINAFGWVEVNVDALGHPSSLGAKHRLFQGTGVNRDQTPDRIGKVVTFTPSNHFAFYYEDVSEPLDDGSRGCIAYTLFNFTEPRCLEVTGGQGDHDLVVFSNDAGSSHPTYWVAAEDPTDCTHKDGDCNLTVVKIAPARRR